MIVIIVIFFTCQCPRFFDGTQLPDFNGLLCTQRASPNTALELTGSALSRPLLAQRSRHRSTGSSAFSR